MADKITNKSYYEVNMTFADEDTRKFKVPNPTSSINIQTAVSAFDSAVSGAGGSDTFLIGDRAGAAFVGVLTVDSVNALATEFDLS